MGPVASQEAIKQLGTNGGGFFNANAAHPFENPNPLTNFLSMFLIFAIPAGLTYTFGRMAGDQRQGWALFGAMAFLFFAGVTRRLLGGGRRQPAIVSRLGVEPGLGNMEGKEVRFGVANSALYATVTTDASCGAVNAMHDSFTPLGGLVPLFNIQLGEVVFGGVGRGPLRDAGDGHPLRLHRRPDGRAHARVPGQEDRDPRGQARDALRADLPAGHPGLRGLVGGGAVRASRRSTTRARTASREILYAFTSATGNNGSAFAGISANTPWYNTTLGLAMLIGRFWMIVPALAIAGILAGKKAVAARARARCPPTGPLFAALLVGVIVIVGALTFFPVLSLGPIVEHFLAAGRKGVLKP